MRDDVHTFQGNLLEGLEKKEAAIERVWVRTDPDWKQDFARVVMSFARFGVEFTSDDVCAVVGRPPNQNAVGAAMHKMSQTGQIERVGYQPSRRTDRHGAIIAVWRGAR